MSRIHFVFDLEKKKVELIRRHKDKYLKFSRKKVVDGITLQFGNGKNQAYIGFKDIYLSLKEAGLFTSVALLNFNLFLEELILVIDHEIVHMLATPSRLSVEERMAYAFGDAGMKCRGHTLAERLMED